MKKKLLIITALILSVFAYGQKGVFKKGTFLISGATQASFSSNSFNMGGKNDKDMKVSTFVLNASMGYFLNEKVVVGGMLSYASVGLPKEMDAMDKVSLSALNAFGRYYFKLPESGSKMAFYGQANLGINKVTLGKDGNTGSVYGLSVGTNYFLTKKLSLDAALNYSKASFKVEGHNHNLKATTLNFLVGISYAI